MQRRAVVLLLSICVLLTPAVAAAAPVFEPVQKELAQGVYIQILPRMELLAGVQSHTTWMNKMGPKGNGPTYYRELREFFEPYSNHRAVELSEERLNSGFSYDAPPHFVLRLGPLPELEKKRSYGSYLVGRGQGEDNLDEFRTALRDLASESEFATFFSDHRGEYQRWIDETVEDWLRDFYGWEGGVYYIVLAPAMFPGGGYGASFELEDGRLAIYQTVRESGRSEDEPEFGKGKGLEKLTLHEWGHSFVNPTLEQYPAKVRGLEPLFAPVSKMMADQAYPSVETFMNEQVLRAATTLAAREIYGEDAYLEALGYEESRGFYLYEESRGFYLTEHIVGLLEYYRTHRDEYPTFRDFAPYMLDRLDEDKEELASTYKSGEFREWLLPCRLCLWWLLL